MRMLRSLLPALLAATTLGSAAALAAESSPQQSALTQASGSEANIPTYSTWNCYTYMDGVYRGQVTIWWGHRQEDAMWACNNWKSECGNSHGGCYVTPVHP